MTCRDCYHYEVCLALESNGVSMISPRQCGCFKDKSYFIELPCRIGDKVYSDSGCFGIGEYVIEVIFIGEGNKVESFTAYWSDDDVLIDDIDFEPSAIGRTVFLTREEAVKAWKEELKNETEVEPNEQT